MGETIRFATQRERALADIAEPVRAVAERSGIRDGLVHGYAQGAKAAILIQEGWDQSVREDVIALLSQPIPKGIWRHGRQDGNGDAHLKAGRVGPSETVPSIEGTLGLSTWQSLFFCEFDGPRAQRRVVETVMGDR